ncbi:MAG TPA: acyltransferase [Variovorax sp.]|nr:acyltransferase [Variovorax sp.]
MNDFHACIDAFAHPACIQGDGGAPWPGAAASAALTRALDLSRDPIAAGDALSMRGDLLRRPIADAAILPFAGSLLMLACLFAAVLGSAMLLSRRAPGLSSQAHAQTRWLDGLRGLAVTLVMLNHAPLVLHNLQLAPTVFALSAETRILLDYLGSIGVQIFFCITGCLFARQLLPARNVDWPLFFVRRIQRLVPAYVVAVLAAIAVAALFSRVDRQFVASALDAIPRMMAFGFYPLPRVGAFETSRLLGMSWTLAFEWRFYVVLPLVFMVIRLGRAPGSVAIALVAVVLMLVEGLGVWMFFALGALASPLTRLQPTAGQCAAARGALFVCVASMVLNWAVVDRDRILQGLHVLALFACVAVTRPRLLSSRSTVTLGTLSYSLYLLHVMVFFAVFGLCHAYAFDVAALSPFAFTLLAGLAVALAMALSALSYLLLERRFIDFRPRPEPRPVR